jgi:hypothetical protein
VQERVDSLVGYIYRDRQDDKDKADRLLVVVRVVDDHDEKQKILWKNWYLRFARKKSN